MDTLKILWDQLTANPVNTLKWVLVFAVLILGYVITVPLYKKVSYRLSWERKRDIARSRNHIIRATLKSKHPTGEPGSYNWYGRYQYATDGEAREYSAYFAHPSSPPRILYLYYLNDPRKLFSCSEYHYGNHKAIILVPLMFLPWILAVITVIVLKIDIPT